MVGALLGAAGGLINFIQGISNKKTLRKAQGEIPKFGDENVKLAQKGYGEALTQANAEDPAVIAAKDAAAAQAARVTAEAERAGENPILAAANAAGMANQQNVQLAQLQSQGKMQRQQQKSAALQGLMGANAEAYQAKTQEFGELMQLKGSENSQYANLAKMLMEGGMGLEAAGIKATGEVDAAKIAARAAAAAAAAKKPAATT